MQGKPYYRPIQEGVQPNMLADEWNEGKMMMVQSERLNLALLAVSLIFGVLSCEI